MCSPKKTDNNKQIEINICQAGYYDYQNSCEYLLFLAVKSISKKSLYSVSDKTLVNKACHVKKLDDFNNRSAILGICALTVIHDEGKDYFLIHKRSDKVAEAVNAISMVPCGGIVYWDKLSEDEVIRYTVEREFEEELLGRFYLDNVDAYSPDEAWSEYGDEISFSFLGMGLDPLTTKLEMIICLEMTAVSFRGICGKVGDIKEIVKNLPGNSEGGIYVADFDEKSVVKWMNYKDGMPVFREGMRLVNEYMFNNVIP